MESRANQPGFVVQGHLLAERLSRQSVWGILQFMMRVISRALAVLLIALMGTGSLPAVALCNVSCRIQNRLVDCPRHLGHRNDAASGSSGIQREPAHHCGNSVKTELPANSGDFLGPVTYGAAPVPRLGYCSAEVCREVSAQSAEMTVSNPQATQLVPAPPLNFSLARRRAFSRSDSGSPGTLLPRSSLTTLRI